MAEIVDLQLLLVVVHGPFGVGEGRLVDRRVADDAVDGLVRAEIVKFSNEVLDGLEAGEIELDGREVFEVKILQFGNQFHFLHVANAADDVVLTAAEEGLGGPFTEARRRACDDDQLLVAELLLGFDNVAEVPQCGGFDLQREG